MVNDVVINGLSAVGKDTFIELVGNLAGDGTVITNCSSIDPFRLIPTKFGWEGEKDENYRQCLSLLKEASTYIDDYPTNYLMEFRDASLDYYAGKNIINFYHIREASEIAKLKARLPGLTTLIVLGSPDQKIIESDKTVLDYDYDVTILNDGTLSELEELAKIFLESLGGPVESNSNNI